MASFTGIIKTLQDLTAQTTAEDTDLIPIGTSVLKKISFANLRKALGVDALNSNMSKWHMLRQTVTVPGGATAVNVNLSDMIVDCPVVAQRITNAGSVGVAGARAYAGYVTISLTAQVSASDAQVAFSIIYYC